jgi:hypothetical protein
MTDRIERRLPEILTAISAPQVPDYFDDILGLTARRRQRPGWTFPGRWLPMDIAAPRPAVARMHWRPIGIVILLILALAAAVLVYLGSRPSRLAPFYGPAANGSFVYVRNGDIFIADADLQSERLLVGGPTYENVAGWSNDGGTILFGRSVAGGSLVMAVDPDGRNVRQVNSNVVSGTTTEAYQGSPDGKTLAVISSAQSPATLELLPLDGGDELRVLPLGDIEPARYVSWLPPKGDELVFLGHPHGYLDEIGLYRIRPDGTGLTQMALQRGESLPEVSTQISFQDMTFSDDGKTAAYWNWETAISPDKECFVHLMDVATGEDRRMSFDPSAGCELLPRLLGDGRILLERQDKPTETAQLLIAPADGSGPGTTLGERYNTTLGWDLSPDRAKIVFAADLGPGMLISTDTGAVEEANIGLPVLPSWQRLPLSP